MGRWLSVLVAVLLWVPALCHAGGGWSRSGVASAADTTKWYDRVYQLHGVTVSSRRQKYRRRGNPAVELMRKVIAARQRTGLEHNDYYACQKYQKITLSAHDIKPDDLRQGLLGKIPGLVSQVEASPFTGRLIIPVTYTETVTRHIYRRRPKAERDVVLGERSEGINTLFQTGEALTAALKDFFTDINIYDDQIHLLQHQFTSPIGREAIRFYRFFIVDTLQMGTDRCVQVHFAPGNEQDFGFAGDLFVLDDSSYQVKRCVLTIPRKSGVNFIDGMSVVQEFVRTAGGRWVLAADDMAVELSLFSFLRKTLVVRQTRLTGYRLDPIPDAAFSVFTKAEVEKQARRRNAAFWQSHRPIALSGSEARMGSFIKGLRRGSAYRYVMPVLKLLVENYVETGSEQTPSKVDIGPVNTLLTSNFIDGLRTRISAQTTAALHPHLFLAGYYAYGWRSKRHYYKGELTYSLNRKEHLPTEFPMRYVSLSSAYDVCAPADKFLATDKDNVFTTLKWTRVDKMMFYRRHALSLVREERWGLCTTLALKLEDDEACGALSFRRPGAADGPLRLKTTELTLQLRYAPGEKFVSTKQRRRPLNHDVPVVTLSHTVGLKGVLGGAWRSNQTELSVSGRLWLHSWGTVDVDAKAGAQWNQVPFPLLCLPAANLSYVSQQGTFGLVNNMEFLNDRYVSLMLNWDLNGKLFNRLPLIRRLKWREYLGVRTLWGTLTDKNNPLTPHAASAPLMAWPDGSWTMDSAKPYVEVVAGVHNVFRFFHVEYVRRLNYLSLPTAHRQGIRVRFSVKF